MFISYEAVLIMAMASSAHEISRVQAPIPGVINNTNDGVTGTVTGRPIASDPQLQLQAGLLAQAQAQNLMKALASSTRAPLSSVNNDGVCDDDNNSVFYCVPVTAGSERDNVHRQHSLSKWCRSCGVNSSHNNFNGDCKTRKKGYAPSKPRSS